MPFDAGDRDDRHRPERDGELDHPRLEDEPEREQERVAADGRHHAIRAARPSANARAPPCDGCRTYGAPSVSAAIRPTAIDAPAACELDCERRSPAVISSREGARFVVSVPGWVGTMFQSSTLSVAPELGEDALHDRRRRLGRA